MNPPNIAQGTEAALLIAFTAAIVGFAVRGALRDPRYPRWVSIVIVIPASNFGLLVAREFISQQEYHRGLREGAWIYVWLTIYTVVFCAICLVGHQVLPVASEPLDEEVPPGGDEQEPER